jgi:intracellular sulfur oxidation DsrE/DsrF family protein
MSYSGILIQIASQQEIAVPRLNFARLIRIVFTVIFLLCSGLAAPAFAQAKVVQTPYQIPKALVEIFLDDPGKLGSALNWLRGLINPLTVAPYGMVPEDMHIVVLMHGTEIVTLARKNEARFSEVVQRMRYYADLGVKFKVCGLALKDYDYQPAELYDFVEVVPSAIPELMHWQNQGYALIPATVLDKKMSIDQIR